MLIGIDFDNTIADYDRVFPEVAVAEGLLKEVEAQSKRQVRDLLRQRPNGEKDWMRLQGRVYGAHMEKAELIIGVDNFLVQCRQNEVPVKIVSHKTEFGHFDEDRISLREAARNWMLKKRFFDAAGYGLLERDVIFEATREDKVARIAEIGCTHFIDDLEEVFEEPGFPSDVKKYLYAPGLAAPKSGPYTAYTHWNEISDAIFGS